MLIFMKKKYIYTYAHTYIERERGVDTLLYADIYEEKYIYIYIRTYIHRKRERFPQSTNCTATYLPSRKLSKLDEPDMQDTAGEAGMSS